MLYGQIKYKKMNKIYWITLSMLVLSVFTGRLRIPINTANGSGSGVVNMQTAGAGSQASGNAYQGSASQIVHSSGRSASAIGVGIGAVAIQKDAIGGAATTSTNSAQINQGFSTARMNTSGASTLDTNIGQGSTSTQTAGQVQTTRPNGHIGFAGTAENTNMAVDGNVVGSTSSTGASDFTMNGGNYDGNSNTVTGAGISNYSGSSSADTQHAGVSAYQTNNINSVSQSQGSSSIAMTGAATGSTQNIGITHVQRTV
jgi:hypothetical protein